MGARFAAFLLVAAAAACGAFSGENDGPLAAPADASIDAIGADGSSNSSDAPGTSDAGTADDAPAPDAADVDSAQGIVVLADDFESDPGCKHWSGAAATIGAVSDGGAHGGASFCRVCVIASGGVATSTNITRVAGSYVLGAWVRSPTTSGLGVVELNMYRADSGLAAVRMGEPTPINIGVQWSEFNRTI